MKFETRISKIENCDVTIRGEKLSSMVANFKFSDAIFLEISGRKPTSDESVLFEKILVSVIDHGMGTTSSLSTRFVASGGNSLNVGVGAGILSQGDYHGGAIENAMKQFYAWVDDSSGVKGMISDKKTIFGFGHRVYKNGDPRVKVILAEMEKIGYKSKHLHLMDLVEGLFLEVKGRKIPINIDGLIAVLLCDFGFDALLGKGIFIIGRVPGLVAQCFEELKFEKPVRRLDEDDIEYLG
jgi:citryl-CoA lyase